MGFGQFVNVTVCPTCQGAGQSIKERCADCAGEGRKQEESTLKVTIPAGVSEGNYLTLSGQGNAGKRGGPAGNALVVIQEKEHDLFLRDNDDVVLDLDITFPQASLGAEVEVPTLTGHSLLKIQAGTQSGTLLRMRDKGIPHLNRSGKGDQLVRVQIVTPSRLTKQEREVLQQLSELEHFKGTTHSNRTANAAERAEYAEEPAHGLFDNLRSIFS